MTGPAGRASPPRLPGADCRALMESRRARSHSCGGKRRPLEGPASGAGRGSLAPRRTTLAPESLGGGGGDHLLPFPKEKGGSQEGRDESLTFHLEDGCFRESRGPLYGPHSV